jgi:replicative DNA helicase
MSIASVSEAAERRAARGDSRPTGERLPPYSHEAEQGILGCVLDVMASAGAMLDTLEAQKFIPEFFYDLRHRTIYEAMVKLRAANKPVDIISVQQTLKDGGLLDDIGGILYLSELQDSISSAAGMAYYVTVVREKALIRAFTNKCVEFQRRIVEAEDVEKLIAEASGELLELSVAGQGVSAWKPLKNIVQDVITDMEEFRYVRGKTQLRGLPTGPTGVYLDKMLRGIRETYYMVLAGRPGDGKTTKAMNILEHLALDYVWHEPTGNKLLNHETNEEYPETVERKGIPIAVFSIEMDSTSLGYRLMFGRAGVDTAEFSQGFASATDHVNLVKVAGHLSKAEVYVDDTPAQSIGQIAAKARQIAREKGIKLFILDYVQLVEIEDGKGIERVKELTKISRGIMRLKKELKVPWIVLAQMNRNIETSEKARRPVMSDLKDCGALEQDADVILMLNKPATKYKKKGDTTKTNEDVLEEITGDWDWSKKPKLMEIVVAKNRYGPVGTAMEIFFTNLTKFEDWHLFKVKHGVEQLKEGEREAQILPPKIDDEDVP